MDDSQIWYIGCKKPDTLEDLLYDFIYVKFTIKQDKSLVLDLRIVVPWGRGRETLVMKMCHI
jgi:hypothetical protein